MDGMAEKCATTICVIKRGCLGCLVARAGGLALTQPCAHTCVGLQAAGPHLDDRQSHRGRQERRQQGGGGCLQGAVQDVSLRSATARRTAFTECCESAGSRKCAHTLRAKRRGMLPTWPWRLFLGCSYVLYMCLLMWVHFVLGGKSARDTGAGSSEGCAEEVPGVCTMHHAPCTILCCHGQIHLAVGGAASGIHSLLSPPSRCARGAWEHQTSHVLHTSRATWTVRELHTHQRQ